MTNTSMRRGDTVEVRNAGEVLATLDERGTVDGLPFMPEMVGYCGQRFTVEARADRVCDTIEWTGTRHLTDSLYLGDERCDGKAHGGCQAECRLLWKEVWLRSVDASTPASAPSSPIDIETLIACATASSRTTVEVDGRPEERFRCQATDLLGCTTHVKLWDARSYLNELTSGNVAPGTWAKVMARAAVEEPARVIRRHPRLFIAGEPGPTPTADSLHLQPGELVRVKRREEIQRTLNDKGRNKGLWFDREMLQFCGRTFRVRQRVTRFVNDQDGLMIELTTDSITLDDAACSGHLSQRRWFCARAILPYWRECWLERVGAPVEPISHASSFSPTAP